MSLKYFHYVSSTKVEMLSSQLHQGWLASLKITPKISIANVEVGAELETKDAQNLIRQTVSLIQSMEKKELIKPLMASVSQPNTSDYWHDEDVWFNGLYRFGGKQGVVSYFLWKIYHESILLLVGSPLNILGKMEIQGETALYSSTADILDEISSYIQFFRTNIKINEDALTLNSDSLSSLLPHLSVSKFDVASNINPLDSADLYRCKRISSRALIIAILCLKYLSKLPQTRIDTTFKMMYKLDLERPEDLPDWYALINAYGIEFGDPRLKRIRSVFIGSPIYTALL